MSLVARWGVPASFVLIAAALFGTVCGLDMAGYHTSVGFLSGQFDPDGVNATMFRGGVYVAVWLALCVVGPSLLLSAGLYGVWSALDRR
ncbi:MAG: hypothetical protein ACI9MC_003585 [Kiritimatiellia bacterium]|jgi:hypothetical protein